MTTLIRFDPYREATALQSEMGRFIHLLGAGNGNTGRQRDWLGVSNVNFSTNLVGRAAATRSVAWLANSKGLPSYVISSARV